MIKRYLLIILAASVLFISGFVISAYIIGKHSERQMKELVVNEKLLLMNSIATGINNTEGVLSAEAVLYVLCSQLPYIKKEALDLGLSNSKYIYPNHIEYADLVIEQYKNISEKLKLDVCS